MALTIPVSEIVEKSKNPLLGKHESWGRVLLGDVATILNGFAFKSSEFSNNRGIPLIRIRDVGKDRSETNYLGEYDSRYIVEPGDLLVGMDGDFNCARWRGPRGLLNQRVCKISLTSDIYLPKFLDYTLPGYLKAINDVTSSVTVKHLSSRSIQEILLPLPPKEVQQRLVAEIEKQFSRLDEAVTNLKRIKANLKRYKAAVLKAAVEGKLTEDWRKDHPNVEPASKLLERILAERRAKWKGKGKYKEPVAPDTNTLSLLPSGWTWASVDQVAEVHLGKMLDKQKHRTGRKLPYLRNINVRWGRIDTADLLEMFFKNDELERYGLLPGDVLVCEGGEPGRAAVWDGRITELKFQKALHRVRFYGNTEPRYLVFLLEYLANTGRLIRWFTGSTIKHFTRESFIAMSISLPPHAEQKEIVDEVERRLSVIEVLETTVNANLIRAVHLRQSVLEKAFSGRLVPEGPDAESASVLLSHLQDEIGVAIDKTKTRQKSSSIPEKEAIMTDLVEALRIAGGWIAAQEAFRLYGVADGADTNEVERVYGELRECIHLGQIEVERRGEQDWLRLVESKGG